MAMASPCKTGMTMRVVLSPDTGLTYASMDVIPLTTIKEPRINPQMHG